VPFGASGERIIDTLFFKLRLGRYEFDKKSFRTRYAEHVFSHPVQSGGIVVHSGESSMRNVDALFFLLRWDRYGFDRKRFRTHCAELVFLYPLGYVGHVVHSGASEVRTSTHYFSCSGGTGTEITKIALGHVTPNFCSCMRWDLRVT
jgi:hypothetical protein